MAVGENRLAPLPFVKFCQQKPWRCSPSKETRRITLDDSHRNELERVQREVNRDIAPSAHLPINSNAPWHDRATVGYCYDFALAKRSRLLDRGYPSSALLLAVAIIPDGTAHLVLVAVTDRGDYVLDNLQPDVVRWDSLPYRWVMRSMPENPQYWQAILKPRLLSEIGKPADGQGSPPRHACS